MSLLSLTTTTVNPFVHDVDVLAGNATFNCTGNKAITDLLITRIILCILYVTIFSIAVVGNSLVVYVVIINKDMQSATNLFITNLAMSDLLVNFTSLWLTPIYTYVGHWVWGSWLCYGLPLFQGTSIFISTLTLMAIAIDRYFVICRGPIFGYDLRTHMSLQLCFAIITLIWTISVLLVMPYAVHMRMIYIPEPCNFWLCIEDWAMDDLKSFYGIIVALLQFIVPFIIIGKSYCQIYFFLRDRTSLVKPRNAQPTPFEEQRRRRLLRMLFTMVMLFAVCWAPFNFLNISRDLHIDGFMKPYFSIFFLSAHVISMTATCWNPLVYAWMNETFRAKFIIVWPWLQRFSSEQPRRPRYITECKPATNRINCSDLAAPAKSKKNLGGGKQVTIRQPLMPTNADQPSTSGIVSSRATSSQRVTIEEIEMNDL